MFLNLLPTIPPWIVPNIHLATNIFISLTPLYTYGTACWSIRRKQSLAGFSLDICATMLMALILRILYYFIAPYEVLLLRQSVVMVLVQCVLLRTALRCRPAGYDPADLAAMPLLRDKWAGVPKVLLSHYTYTDPAFYTGVAGYAAALALVVVHHILAFFDVHYQRPWSFWQWEDEACYWRYLRRFTLGFAITTAVFHRSLVYASFVGVLGLFIEALLPLPQILMLHRLHSVQDFKLILLVLWLGGDLMKLLYLFYGATNISVIFLLAGFFQMFLDLIILAQYFYFRTLDKRAERAQAIEMQQIQAEQVV